MKCPSCQEGDTSVIDSRKDEAMGIRRRRKCPTCALRFTTYELTKEQIDGFKTALNQLATMKEILK